MSLSMSFLVDSFEFQSLSILLQNLTINISFLPVDYFWTVYSRLDSLLPALDYILYWTDLCKFAACPDLMPVSGLRVALSLLLCLLVIDPDFTTKITKKLQMDPHFAEASLRLSEVFSLH